MLRNDTWGRISDLLGVWKRDVKQWVLCFVAKE